VFASTLLAQSAAFLLALLLLLIDHTEYPSLVLRFS